jgi:hypothetical protein
VQGTRENQAGMPLAVQNAAVEMFAENPYVKKSADDPRSCREEEMPGYSSFFTVSFTFALMSRNSFTGTSYSPISLMGSASAILRFSIV